MRENGDYGSWTDVPDRRKSKNHNNKEGSRKGGAVSEFYISNLPPGCNPWDVADSLRDFGETAGMYIARKNNKNGDRFGFISFKNVKDVKGLESTLNGTKMGGCRLRVNIARFANENSNFWEAEERLQQNADPLVGKKTSNDVISQKTNSSRKEGISYKDMVASKHCNKSEKSGNSKFMKQERVVEVHDETSAFFAFQEKSVAGRTRDIRRFSDLNVLLVTSGYPKAKVCYVGGLYVIIVFPEDYEAVEFIKKYDVWNEWFSSLDMWEGQSLPYERLAWINFDGVPVHLAENMVFNKLAEHYGQVVHASELSLEVIDLSVNRAGVLVDHGELISDTAFLSWKGRRYKVWISEEQSDWVPECLADVFWPDSDAEEEEESQSPVDSEEKLKSQELVTENLCTREKMKEVFNSHINAGDGNIRNNISRTEDVGPKKQQGGKKKKPFDLSKDSNRKVSKQPSPGSNCRPNKRTSVDMDQPFDINFNTT
ncbi:putative RNA recognition motif domain, nucleotide-binding alpha-beta plait domain superfamily [Helianthus debilis subsp. tardiflorus]